MWVQVEEVGRTLDLSKMLDRTELVLTLARAFFLLVVMASSAPLLSRCPALYSIISRGPEGQEKERYTEGCNERLLELELQSFDKRSVPETLATVASYV